MNEKRTQSISRELSRISRWIRFGTELNVRHFDRNSSFNAFLSFDPNLEEKRIFKQKSLKSVENIWNSLKSRENSEQNAIAERILALIRLHARHIHWRALPVLFWSLFESKNEDKSQSVFRRLAINLIKEETFRSRDLLLLAAIVGRKSIDRSRALRAAFAQFYAREFTETEIEEILVFGSKFNWTHRDVIKLCHVTENPLTRVLMGRQQTTSTDDDMTSQVAKRVRVLRSKESKIHEVVKALELSTLEPKNWFQVLNTFWKKESKLWLKVIQNVSSDRALSLLPRVVNKFPNNEHLVKSLAERVREGSEENSHFIYHLVCIYCSRNILKIRLDLMQRLTASLDIWRKKSEEKPRKHCLTAILDSSLSLDEKYFSLEKRARKRMDLIDQLSIRDLLNAFPIAFRLLDQTDKELTSDWLERSKVNDLHFPFNDLNAKNILFFTQEQQDIDLWPRDDRKLIIVHLVRRKLDNLGHFRSNVLILNGFSVRFEELINEFLDTKEDKKME